MRITAKRAIDDLTSNNARDRTAVSIPSRAARPLAQLKNAIRAAVNEEKSDRLPS